VLCSASPRSRASECGPLRWANRIDPDSLCCSVLCESLTRWSQPPPAALPMKTSIVFSLVDEPGILFKVQCSPSRARYK
jgi:hypothetical protein